MALCSSSGKLPLHQISCLEAVRLGCRMVDRRLGNTAPVKYQRDRITLIPYLLLWDFARLGGKTSYGFVKRCSGYIWISFSVTALTRRGVSTRTNSDSHIEGILPKGPYLPCVSMAGRVLSAGYHRYVRHETNRNKIFQNCFINANTILPRKYFLWTRFGNGNLIFILFTDSFGALKVLVTGISLLLSGRDNKN